MEADSLIPVFFLFSASDRMGKSRNWNRSRAALSSINSLFDLLQKTSSLLLLQGIKDVSCDKGIPGNPASLEK